MRPRIPRAPVGRFHDPGPTTSDHCKARGTQQVGRAARELVGRVVLDDSRRAEDGNGGPDAGQRLKAGLELVPDALDPLRIGLRREDRLRLGAE